MGRSAALEPHSAEQRRQAVEAHARSDMMDERFATLWGLWRWTRAG